MAPAPPYSHKVPMLAGGAAAADFVARFSSLGVRAEVVGAQIGIASATKMCRSIMVKGLETLITECMLAASLRAREMEEVAETLRAAGVDPIMTEAIVRRMDWSVEAGLLELFHGEAPASCRDLVGMLQATSGTSRREERKAPPAASVPPP
jgi:hypothetical protein